MVVPQPGALACSASVLPLDRNGTDKAALHKWIDKWFRAKKRQSHWSIIAVAEQFPAPKYLDYAREGLKEGQHNLPWNHRFLIKILRDAPDASTIETAEQWILQNGHYRESKIVCELLTKQGSPVVAEENIGAIDEEKLQLLEALLLAFPSESLKSVSMDYLKNCPRTSLNALFLEFLLRNRILEEPENMVELWCRWRSKSAIIRRA